MRADGSSECRCKVTSIEDRVRLVREESERLKEYANALSPDALTLPSACHRWEVGDVLAHLAGGAELYASSISRGLQGDSSPPPGFPGPGAFGPAQLSGGIADRAINLRRTLGDHLLPSFNTRNDELNQAIQRLTQGDWDKPCYHPMAVLPASIFVSFRMLELSVHSWDIRSKLDRTAHLSDDAVSVLMDMMPNMVEWSFKSGERLPAPVRLRFDLRGPVQTRTDLIVEGDVVSMEPAATGDADYAFTCESEAFLLMMLGRITPDRCAASGRLVVVGRHAGIAELRRWFGG